ncbi:hypothetical protein bthur0008_53060 [Bacillus thuringiensis serovar berliner ATCC 10792]|nr:hypothetical protein bthur0008_53060 [Bacillus thuringiensis serovar berliner ATCC 10792]
MKFKKFAIGAMRWKKIAIVMMRKMKTKQNSYLNRKGG